MCLHTHSSVPSRLLPVGSRLHLTSCQHWSTNQPQDLVSMLLAAVRSWSFLPSHIGSKLSYKVELNGRFRNYHSELAISMGSRLQRFAPKV